MDNEEGSMTDSRDLAYDIIVYGVQPVLLFFGIIGNVMSIGVLSRKSLRSSTAVYLMAIAIVSLIYVVFYLPFIIKEFIEDGSDTYVLVMVSYQCYIGIYIIESMGAAAIWITTIVGIERCIYLLMPRKVQFFCRSKVASIVSGVTVIACLLRNIPRCFECRPLFHPNATNATGDLRLIYLRGYDRMAAIFADTIISSIIPFVIIVISNIVLIYILIKSQRRSNQLPISQPQSDKTLVNIQTRKMEGVTILVLVNTVLFTLSHALGTVLHINVFIHGMAFYEKMMMEPIGFYSNTSSLAYYCFTSVLYLLISSIYRRKLKKIFKSILQRSSGPDSSENVDIFENSCMDTELKSFQAPGFDG